MDIGKKDIGWMIKLLIQALAIRQVLNLVLKLQMQILIIGQQGCYFCRCKKLRLQKKTIGLILTIVGGVLWIMASCS